jgi:hypothetical protein
MNTQKINDQIVNDLKKFNWQFVINYGNSLEELNDRQLRFLKGFVCEELIASQDPTLKCLREDHRDFTWEKHGLDIELKTQFSFKMYDKQGSLLDISNIQFTNSNGTNTKKTLDPKFICDLTLVLRSDGAVIADKQTVMDHLIKTGDGFRLNIPKEKAVEISGRVLPNAKYTTDFKSLLSKAVRESIEKYNPCLKN